ncbi:MAG: TonB-dependent receptor [Holophagales bacterium]|nr:TonB-dependent receptor [Holophagales bacterium]
MQLAYTWSHFKYTEVNSLFGSYSDTFMPNAPEHQLFLDVAYTLLPSLVLGASLDVVSRWAVDPSNQTWVDGYALVNARLAYRWRAKSLRGELTLSGKNLAGKDYIAFSEPDPDGNSYQPGPRQQVFAGVRIFLD